MERTGWRSPDSAPKRRRNAIFAAAALLALALCGGCAREKAAPVAVGHWLSYVFDKKNSCLLRRSGEIGWAEVAVGSRLFGGDSLKTGHEAIARLRFRDGSSFDLLPESLVVLSESPAGREPAVERPIEIALLEGELSGMVLEPEKARVGVTYGKSAARLAPSKDSTGSLMFRVSARGGGDPVVTAGELQFTAAGASAPRTIKAEVVAAAAPSEPTRFTAPEETPRPRKTHVSLKKAEVPVLSKEQLDSIQERAANLEKIARKNMDALSRVEKAAASGGGAAEKALRGKLHEIRSTLGEVDRLLSTVLRQTGTIKDPSKRSAVVEELKAVEELQREISWEIRTVEAEIAKAKGR